MKLKLRDHVYREIWTPELVETLEVQCERENPVDKYAVCLKTDNGIIIGHLKKGESGRFAKTIFYYLRSHPDAKCTAIVTRKRFNGKGLQVPCTLKITRKRKFVSLLTEKLKFLKEKQ